MPPFSKSGNRNLAVVLELAGDSGNARKFPSARAAGLALPSTRSLLSVDWLIDVRTGIA
jgi:hypothetical protein